MKYSLKLLSILVSVGLVSCASQQPKSGRENVLFNPVIAAQRFEVSVMSNGCTEPEHFYLKVTEDVVELRRTTEDVCRAAPHLIRMAFSYPFEQRVYRVKNKTRFSNRIEKR